MDLFILGVSDHATSKERLLSLFVSGTERTLRRIMSGLSDSKRCAEAVGRWLPKHQHACCFPTDGSSEDPCLLPRPRLAKESLTVWKMAMRPDTAAMQNATLRTQEEPFCFLCTCRAISSSAGDQGSFG